MNSYLKYYLMSMAVVSFFVLLYTVLTHSVSIGVVPAKIEQDIPVATISTITFTIFNQGDQDTTYILVPDENISSIIVQDCNYWCENKTYFVPAGTYLTNGTRVTILVFSNSSGEIRGKITVMPSVSGSGTVGVIGSVAVTLDLNFYQPTSSTTTTSTTSASIKTTTTIQHTGGGGGSHKTTTSTTLSTSSTSTISTFVPIITVGVSPAKVYVRGKTTVTFRLWNDKGNVDANFTIEPDENCSRYIQGSLPSSIIVPKGTTMQHPVTLNVTFSQPTESFECSISFFGEPVNYKRSGNLLIKHGVKARVFFQQPSSTTVPSPSESINVFPLLLGSLAVLGLVLFFYFTTKSF